MDDRLLWSLICIIGLGFGVPPSEGGGDVGGNGGAILRFCDSGELFEMLEVGDIVGDGVFFTI